MPISAIHLSNAKSLRCARYEAITYHGIDDSGSLLRGRCEVAASRMVRASSSSGRSPHHLAANMIPAAASLMSSLHSLHTKPNCQATGNHPCQRAKRVRSQMFQVKMLSTYCGLSNFAACSMRHLQLSSMMSNACSMLSSSIACSACTEEDCVSAAALEEYCAEIGVFRGRDRRSVREGEHGGGGRL